MRPAGRSNNQVRPVTLTRNYTKHAEGSVLVEFGDTKVLCTASIEEGVPRFLKGQGQGWITAEYGMLPRSTHTRNAREAAKGKQGGRTMEIQRLIARALRAAVDLKALGEFTITLDCDVLQADGGTRTASITGACVALADALQKLVENGKLKTNPSGRKSPYFFNAGLFNTGRDLALLGRFYAEALVDSGLEFDLLFGPAYKGIPIATTTAVALAEHHDLDLPYCFNRKEAKDHGEGGNLVGSALQGRVMLVDDVITAGTAIRESMEIIQANGATLAGVLISLDRQERGRGEISAIQEVERDYNCKVISIITLKDLIAYLEEKPEMAEHLAAVKAYREEFGV